MKVELVIRTDALTICSKVVEAPRTVDAIIEALGASSGDHLRDMRFANICIQARPHDPMRSSAVKQTLNQEAGNA